MYATACLWYSIKKIPNLNSKALDNLKSCREEKKHQLAITKKRADATNVQIHASIHLYFNSDIIFLFTFDSEYYYNSRPAFCVSLNPFQSVICSFFSSSSFDEIEWAASIDISVEYYIFKQTVCDNKSFFFNPPSLTITKRQTTLSNKRKETRKNWMFFKCYMFRP